MIISTILLILGSTISTVNSYGIECNSLYVVKNDDYCFKLLNKNKISLSFFNSLNPGIDCENLTPGSEVCIDGQINNSSEAEEYNSNEENIEETIASNNYNKEFAANDMANILSISMDQANQYLEIANEAKSYYDDAFLYSVDSNLSVEQCKVECSRAHENFETLLQNSLNIFNIEKYNLYLRSINQKEISNDGLLELCNNNCYIIKEVNGYIKNNKDDTIEYQENTMQKRNVCENVSRAKFNIQYNYKNGFHRYTQAPGSAQTHLVHVNGCSIPVLQNYYDKNNAGLFVPACNSHDMCYGCQLGKDYCDSRFLDNMNLICNRVKPDTSCYSLAKSFYSAVKYGGKGHYDRHRSNQTNVNCAYCGASVIRNQLLLRPFYK